MEIFKRVLQALTGYVGSSESPEKISARFVGASIGVVTFIAPYLAGLLGIGAGSIVSSVQPVGFLVAVIWYIYGAIKAMWNAARVAGYIKQG